MTTIEIWAPRWKDRTVLVAKYKVQEQNRIIFTRAKNLIGKEFFMSGREMAKYPVTTNGKTDCYEVPLDDFITVAEKASPDTWTKDDAVEYYLDEGFTKEQAENFADAYMQYKGNK